MIVCRSCGRQNPPGTQFCQNPQCSAYLEWAGEASPMPVGPAASGGVLGKASVPGMMAAPQGMEQSAGVRVEVAEPNMSVAPGESVVTAVTISNTGTQVENFSVEVAGPAGAWAQVEPAQVQVFPHREGQVSVRFMVPMDPNVPTGLVGFVVNVKSSVHFGLVTPAHGTLNVGAYHDIGVELTPSISKGRRRTRHWLALANVGNTPARIYLGAGDSEEKLTFQMPGNQVELPPGEQIRVPLNVTSKIKWFGSQEEVPFQVMAQVEGAGAAQIDARRRVIPLIPMWMAGALAAVVAIAGTLFMVKAMFFKPTPKPPPPVAAASSSAPPEKRSPCGDTPPKPVFYAAPATPSAKPSAAPSEKPSDKPTEKPADPPVKVANVVGQKQVKALSTLTGQGLKPKVDDEFKEGDLVHCTIPEANTPLDKGSEVVVYMYKPKATKK